MDYRYLIGTHAGLFEALIAPDHSLLSCRKVESGHHYGISVRLQEGKIYSKNQDEYMNVLEIDSLTKTSELHFGSDPGHVHQALKTDVGVFYTDTLHNRLSFRSDNGKHFHYGFDGHAEDYNHINSLYFSDDDIYALLHNRGNKNSEIVRMTLKEDGFEEHERLMFNDTGCHNIYVHGQSVLYNASAAGNLICLDIKTGQEILRKQFEGHTKGMSIVGDLLTIGVSEHAVREERKFTTSGLAFMDKETLKTRRITPIHLGDGTPIGNINEIRCLSMPDLSEGNYIPHKRSA